MCETKTATVWVLETREYGDTDTMVSVWTSLEAAMAAVRRDDALYEAEAREMGDTMGTPRIDTPPFVAPDGGHHWEDQDGFLRIWPTTPQS